MRNHIQHVRQPVSLGTLSRLRTSTGTATAIAFRKSSLALIAMVFCFSIVGCGKPEKAVVEPTSEEIRPVRMFVVGQADASSFRQYPGTIQPFRSAEMAFEVSGKIIEFSFDEGDEVVEGQTIARLDPQNYTASLKVAEANLKQADADLQRSNNIRARNKGAISMSTIEQRERAVEVARAQLEVSRKAFGDTELKAPFSGLIAKKMVEDFANVVQKQKVLVVHDYSELKIEVNVPERDFVDAASISESPEVVTAQLKPVVVLSALPGREFPAQIGEVALQADQTTRTFPVNLRFETPSDVNILPGMTAHVRVANASNSAWSIPTEAARADADGQSYVWKVDSKTMTVHRAPVKLADMVGAEVRVIEGVASGDKIVTSGLAWLKEGMEVRQYGSD